MILILWRHFHLQCKIKKFQSSVQKTAVRPQGYKKTCMLNSAGHKISDAHKYMYANIKKIIFFLAQISLE